MKILSHLRTETGNLGQQAKSSLPVLYGLWAKNSLHGVKWVHEYLQNIPNFASRPTNPKIFITWPFKKKFADCFLNESSVCKFLANNLLPCFGMISQQKKYISAGLVWTNTLWAKRSYVRRKQKNPQVLKCRSKGMPSKPEEHSFRGKRPRNLIVIWGVPIFCTWPKQWLAIVDLFPSVTGRSRSLKA